MPDPTGIGGEYAQLDTRSLPAQEPIYGIMENLNRILRSTYNRLDALEGRRGNVAHGANIDLNSFKVINSGDPTEDTDVVSKRYADENYGVVNVARILQASGIIPAQGISRPLTLFDHFIDAGNVTATGETDLYSDTVAANQLSRDGAKLISFYAGTFVLHAVATRRVRVYFGGTPILDSGALLISGSAASWNVQVEIIRVSSNTVRCSAVMTTSHSALVAQTTYTEVVALALGSAQITKITGESAGGGSANNDVVAKLGSVTYFPSAA